MGAGYGGHVRLRKPSVIVREGGKGFRLRHLLVMVPRLRRLRRTSRRTSRRMRSRRSRRCRRSCRGPRLLASSMRCGHSPIGGIPPIVEGQGPPHWLIYYQVSGIETVIERGNSNGATTYQPPFTVPDTGKIAVLADPQGAVFALFEPLAKG
jgi:hypothetical protein